MLFAAASRSSALCDFTCRWEIMQVAAAVANLSDSRVRSRPWLLTNGFSHNVTARCWSLQMPTCC